MAPASSGQIEIYVFGASVGEGIVLHLPNGVWGVIDCLVVTRVS